MSSLISIIVVTLNAEKYLERCITSILNQTYSNIQLIVIDGGSTDGTVDILKKYNNVIYYWISEPDAGIYNAMNKGLNKASGDWIYFLGADDYLFPGFSELASNIEKSDTIYYGACLWGNKILGEKFTPYKLTRECICHQGILYPSKVFQKYHYDENYKVSSDYLLNIQCWSDKEFHTHYFPLLIACFSQGGSSQFYEEVEFKRNFGKIIKEHCSYWTYLRYKWKQYKENRSKKHD
jgi:glycosyltransferase involved in cell wall biosynthesis